jgi:drug/metabolite transporter (DMT)-like permease
VAGALGAKLLLGEHVTPLRWAGILLVTAGVALVSLT